MKTSVPESEQVDQKGPVKAPSMDLDYRGMLSASLSNCLMLTCLLSITVRPEFMEFMPRAFGPRPFGFPVQAVVFLALALFWVPAIPAACAYTYLIILKRKINEAALCNDWEQQSKLSEKLWPTKRIALFGLGYFVLISVIWIVWAETHGL